MSKKRISIIGYGNMGSAIANALVGIYEIKIFDPYLKNETGAFFSTKEEIESFTDTHILCVKPKEVSTVCGYFKKPSVVLSIAAGVSYDILKAKLPHGSKVARLMPNLALVVKESATGIFGDEEAVELSKEIFSLLGKTTVLGDEKLMDAFTGLSGSGPAYVFSFIQALAEGGVLSGLPYDDALELAVQTLRGSVEYFTKEKKSTPQLHPSTLRNKVTSPGGTTIAGLKVLEENGFHGIVMKAVEAAAKRSKELGG